MYVRDGVKTAFQFLCRVWGNVETYYDLPSHDNMGSGWQEFIVSWPSQKRTVLNRLNDAIADGLNLYFSVMGFREDRRKIDFALPTHWLWADLDEVRPQDIEQGLLPTIGWRTSRGKYQALWAMKSQITTAETSELNKRLTYAVGADKSGWDLTQVLRVPGTWNYKYNDAQQVKIVWESEVQYDHRRLGNKLGWSPVRNVEKKYPVSGTGGTGEGNGKIDDVTLSTLPTRAKALLRVLPNEVVVGERSARLWELECLLAESGLSENVIFKLVKGSAWNKWKGLSSGDDRLLKDVRKAMQIVTTKQSVVSSESIEKGLELNALPRPSESSEKSARRKRQKERGGHTFHRYGRFLSLPAKSQSWLVQNIWSASSYGIIAGEPKTLKSTIALALAMSVASGQPFLMDVRYPVLESGAVFYISEEGREWVIQDRVKKIAAFYGLLKARDVKVAAGHVVGKEIEIIEFPVDLPIWFMCNQGFSLEEEDQRSWIERRIQRLEGKIKLLVFDPLYLLLPSVDIDKQREIVPYLRWMKDLSLKYGVAIIVVHHMKKQAYDTTGGALRLGQRMAGSFTLHSWVESALYTAIATAIRSLDDGANSYDDQKSGVELDVGLNIGINREYRGAGGLGPMYVWTSIGDGLKFEARVSETDDLWELFRDMVVDAGKEGVAIVDCVEAMGVSRKTLLRWASQQRLYVVVGKGRGAKTMVYEKKPSDSG